MKKLLAIASIATLFSIVACDQNMEAEYDQNREDSVVAVRTDLIRVQIVDSMNAVCQSYMTYMQDSLRMAYEASASGSTRPRSGSTTKPSTPSTQPTTTPSQSTTKTPAQQKLEQIRQQQGGGGQ